MIEEAYCSYEVCKLLKEKGFDVPVKRMISLINLVWLLDEAKNINAKVSAYYSQPTQQMAMRWLREEHNLYIQVEFDSQDFFIADIYDMVKVDDYGCPYHYCPTIANCKTYEKAVEAAIKACLETL